MNFTRHSRNWRRTSNDPRRPTLSPSMKEPWVRSNNRSDLLITITDIGIDGNRLAINNQTISIDRNSPNMLSTLHIIIRIMKNTIETGWMNDKILTTSRDTNTINPSIISTNHNILLTNHNILSSNHNMNHTLLLPVTIRIINHTFHIAFVLLKSSISSWQPRSLRVLLQWSTSKAWTLILMCVDISMIIR